MVLGKLSVPGRPTILITVGQGPIVLAEGAGGGGLDKGPLNQNNQPTKCLSERNDFSCFGREPSRQHSREV